MTRIVCGWYTPDYLPWVRALEANLSRLGERHDFVPVPLMRGGWEKNTLRKPRQLWEAMQRHPGETIIFLDVDCEVTQRLDGAEIAGDVGFLARAKIRRSGKTRFSVRSGTIIIRDTEASGHDVDPDGDGKSGPHLCRAGA